MGNIAHSVERFAMPQLSAVRAISQAACDVYRKLVFAERFELSKLGV